MNRFLIPLLFVVHYAILVRLQAIITLDDYHFMNTILCYTISTVVYAMAFFQRDRARGFIIFWHLVIAFNLLSYLSQFTEGLPFMIAAALALWIGALGLTALSDFGWREWGTLHSLRFAVPGLFVLLLTPTLRTVHKWLTPVQLYLLSCIAINLGLPNLTRFDIFNTTTSLAFFVTAAAFCTLGWAYVRFLKGERGARDPAA